MASITLTDWLTMTAIIIGPILAVRIQRYLDSVKERKQRKLNLFHTLMATRASRVSFEHVKALNMIDIEFHNGTKKDKKVRDAWKIYQDHLNNRSSSDGVWSDKSFELLVDLLYEMAQSLNYDFDKVLLKNAYTPVAHANQEDDLLLIRQGLVQLFKGEISLPMDVAQADATDESVATQEKIQEGFKDLLEGKRTLKVKLDDK